MSLIEQPKSYTGRELETIFFRPMLSGAGARELGIRILYNMPVPTTLQYWRRSGDLLQPYAAPGWVGGSPAEKFQKVLRLHKVKAEVGYSAADYFSMVYELVTGRGDVNLDDLSGTVLEEAETELFRASIAESIRVTMWLGDTTRGKFNTFDGVLKSIFADTTIPNHPYSPAFLDEAPHPYETLLHELWRGSREELKQLKSEGNLAYFVTSDVYSGYEESLDAEQFEAAYVARQEGRPTLSFRGIPVIDMQLESYLPLTPELPRSFAVLTDRRNIALAVNTADFPGTEIRMWYNPDAMENRQRAIFMAGCDYLLPELVSYGRFVA